MPENIPYNHLLLNLKNSSKQLDGISFQELWDRSEAFAHLLRDAGCKEGDTLCCIVGESFERLAWVLGINKARCECVLIDPAISHKRLHAILEDSAAGWIVADQEGGPFLESEYFENEKYSIGWMADCESLPKGIWPEFIKENLEEYPTVYTGSVSSDFNPFFEFYNYGLKGSYPGGVILFEEKIREYVQNMLERLDINEEDNIGCILPFDRLSFLIQLAISCCSSSEIHLFAPAILFEPETLIKTLTKEGISRLVCRSEDLEHLLPEKTVTGRVGAGVHNLTVLGAMLSAPAGGAVKKLFPQSEVSYFSSLPEAAGPEGDLSGEPLSENGRSGLFLESKEASFVTFARLPKAGGAGHISPILQEVRVFLRNSGLEVKAEETEEAKKLSLEPTTVR